MSKRRVDTNTPLPKPTEIKGLRLDGAFSLLTDDQRDKLDKAFEEDRKTRRQAEARSATLRLG
jgi:hypothetical protein